VIDDLKDNVDELNDNIHAYIKSTFEYYKLDIFKKSMNTTVSLSRVFLIGGIALLFLFFLSFGLALFIGDQLGNQSYGFFIMAGFFLIVLLLVRKYGRKILERKILKTGSKIFFND